MGKFFSLFDLFSPFFLKLRGPPGRKGGKEDIFRQSLANLTANFLPQTWQNLKKEMVNPSPPDPISPPTAAEFEHGIFIDGRGKRRV